MCGIVNRGEFKIMRLAIVGGTGVDEMEGIASGRHADVRTRFGEAVVVEAEVGGAQVVFLPRHGPGHSVPPARINYRAQMAALKKLGVRRVIGVCTVGSLAKGARRGSFAIVTDFIDLTRRRSDTFFDDPEGLVVHTDFTHPYCPEVSDALRTACTDEGVEFLAESVYVGVEGPRYESPAEVRSYASWGGDLVGMTGLPEVVLAREAGLCYGAIAIVSNAASGICPTPLKHEDVRSAARQATESLQAILRRALASISNTPECDCGANTGLVL